MNTRKPAPEEIIVTGAHVHNLKHVDARIPLGKLVGIAGVSGSGKSSLALGVLYAEGSRRYLEALSAYTRRRISQPQEALVDNIENVPAALALHQRPQMPGIRSTFGTASELSNAVRLMFSRLGSHVCPNGHHVPPTADVALGRNLVCPVCGAAFEPPSAESFSFNSTGACPVCQGTGIVRTADEKTFVTDDSLSIREGAVAPWNQLMWAVMPDVCEKMGVRVNIPFRELTQEEKDIVFYGPAEKKHILYHAKTGEFVELDFTFYSAERTVMNSLSKVKDEKGLARVSKFLKTDICPSCHGTRINDQAASSLLCGKTLPEAEAMPLGKLTEWVRSIPDQMPDPALKAIADSVTGQFLRYAKRLLELGLSYLSPNRASNTLSTGERQRVQLAKAIRNQTTGVLYILDEPSIGLHPANIDGLMGVMEDLISHGNSVVLVDHDTRILRQCDYLIEMGPGAGEYGGSVIAQGPVEKIIQSENTRIGPFLEEKEAFLIRKRVPSEKMFEEGRIHLETARIHTVNPLSVDLPKHRLTAVTGVSGAGKTTMILECLIPAVKALTSSDTLPEQVVSVSADGIHRISLIDSTPIGANVRSTVATYAGIMDRLRKLYAGTKQAKELGLKLKDFSYNTGSLRCMSCDGTGQISMDVQFLPDLNLICPECGGLRFSKEAAKICYHGKKRPETENISITDCMGMTVRNALSVFEGIKDIHSSLEILDTLGLSYLTLGEPTPALSGGEAQRLKLASEIGKVQEDAIFVFDEPSIGLHPLDVQVLIRVFQKLLDQGATVIVIEHDLDLIRNSDYVIDMDIDANGSGGIAAVGTPGEIRKNPSSITGRYL